MLFIACWVWVTPSSDGRCCCSTQVSTWELKRMSNQLKILCTVSFKYRGKHKDPPGPFCACEISSELQLGRSAAQSQLNHLWFTPTPWFCIVPLLKMVILFLNAPVCVPKLLFLFNVLVLSGHPGAAKPGLTLALGCFRRDCKPRPWR